MISVYERIPMIITNKEAIAPEGSMTRISKVIAMEETILFAINRKSIMKVICLKESGATNDNARVYATSVVKAAPVALKVGTAIKFNPIFVAPEIIHIRLSSLVFFNITSTCENITKEP